MKTIEKITEFSDLNSLLINHYDCFNRERLFLDSFDEKENYCYIASSITDSCPVVLFRGVARFIKKNINADKFPFIYVGPYAFKTEKL